MSDPLDIVRAFLGERLAVAPDRVTEATSFKDLDVDSMMLLELMFEFEDQLGVKLDRNMATPKTIGQLLEIVGGLQAAMAAG